MRGWGVAVLCALLWLIGLAAPMPAFAQAQDEIVPEGVWRLHLDTATSTQSSAYSKHRHHESLLTYLVPDATVRSALQGSVERRSNRVDMQVTYGLSDTWNLELGVPWVQVVQSASLSATSSDAAVQTQLQRLQSRTVSGPGRFVVASLHRPVFTDRNGLVLGYGLDWPTQRPDSPWAGRGTLLVDSPFPRAFGLLHYTFYPFIPRAHLDFRAELGTPFTETLALVGGGHATVNPGNDGSLSLGWTQEFGPVVTGIAGRIERQGETLINHHRQGDASTAASVRLEVGYGNLNALEAAPIAFPYQVTAQYEYLLTGASVPIQPELRVNLRFYF